MILMPIGLWRYLFIHLSNSLFDTSSAHSIHLHERKAVYQLFVRLALTSRLAGSPFLFFLLVWDSWRFNVIHG